MSVATSTQRTRYETDVDLFSRESLLDPYEDYRTLRDVGPIAYMTRYDMWAVTRYHQVKRVLSDAETFISGEGIGMNQTLNDAWAGLAPTLDGEDHRPIRQVSMATIGPKAAPRFEAQIAAIADEIVGQAVERGEVDAVLDIAQMLPMRVTLTLVGVDPDLETRRNLLHWATDTYNCCGPDGSFHDTLPSMEKLYGWGLSELTRDKVAPGGVGQRTYEAVDRGEVTEEQATKILGGYITAGLDTTASAIGSMLMLFAQNPDQWALVRDQPKLGPSTAAETVRMETPAQWFTRVTSRDVEFEDVAIPKGTRMLHNYGAANRDERRYPDPDRFDVTRNPRDHLAFGRGTHTCQGKWVSNLEVHALLRSLCRRVQSIELVGEPVRHVNNLIRSLDSLPVRLHAR